MKDFSGRIAVVTGGGSGIGRELVRLLVAEGCHVAIADVSPAGMAETERLCREDGMPQGTRIVSIVTDVSQEDQLEALREQVAREFGTDHVNLLINNAGIGAGASMFVSSREEWERTFSITFGGVYLGTRVFLPAVVASDEGWIVNVSSVNGFWATPGGGNPNSAYSTAKFAVKGFTESLLCDLRVNAPHVGCSLVMPGFIGTDIIANSYRISVGRDDAEAPSASELAVMRARIAKRGMDEAAMSDAQVLELETRMSDGYRMTAPTTAAEAAKIILDGVRAGEWRILVGEDAHELDAKVRANPEAAYDPDFFVLFGTPELVGQRAK
ncbi:MAG: SDR family oxidoreductase [Novosphingobium sp.]|nr:SDR family oxidoreductase [Novosphingobium sp.]